MIDNSIQTKTLPMLALRGLHVFPEVPLTFDVERQASVRSCNGSKIWAADFPSTQKNLNAHMPQEADVYQVGTVCRIRQQPRQPRGNCLPGDGGGPVQGKLYQHEL
ncbi:MAG: LON peptidase substrate-binding domain-containing protein [Oscillospiraceae bacterium]